MITKVCFEQDNSTALEELVGWTGSSHLCGMNGEIMAEGRRAHLCSGGRSPLSSSPAPCDRNSAASGTWCRNANWPWERSKKPEGERLQRVNWGRVSTLTCTQRALTQSGTFDPLFTEEPGDTHLSSESVTTRGALPACLLTPSYLPCHTGAHRHGVNREEWERKQEKWQESMSYIHGR